MTLKRPLLPGYRATSVSGNERPDYFVLVKSGSMAFDVVKPTTGRDAKGAM